MVKVITEVVDIINRVVRIATEAASGKGHYEVVYQTDLSRCEGTLSVVTQ